MSALETKATSGGGDDAAFEIPEAGPQPAVLVAVIDLGSHPKTFAGKPPKLTRELYFAWELPEQKIAGTTNRNHVLQKTMTFSFHEKSGMRKMVEQWSGKKYKDGDTFDPEKMLGAACLLNVTHKETHSGRTVANVDGVMRLPKGQLAPASTLTPIFHVTTKSGPVPTAVWLPFLWDGAIGKMVHPGDYVRTSNEFRGVADEPANVRRPAVVDDDLTSSVDDNGTEEDIPF